MKVRILTCGTDVTNTDRDSMHHFFALWREFNVEIDNTTVCQPTPLSDRVHLFGIFANSWGMEAY